MKIKHIFLYFKNYYHRKPKVSVILTLLVLFFLFNPFFSIIRADRNLEVNYPTFGDKTLGPGMPNIPEYVQYVFVFAVGISGLILLGVLISGGILWFTSAGNPNQTGEARKKIFAAIFGIIILFGGWLILNTINPEVANLAFPGLKPPPFAQLEPGIYVCNYNVINKLNLSASISDYLGTNDTKKEKAKKDLTGLMKKDDSGLYCYLINSSGDLEFSLKNGNYTIFALPRVEEKIVNQQKVINKFYDFGVIGYEGKDTRGQCKLFYNLVGPKIYDETAINGAHFPAPPAFTFDIQSVILFQKPAKEIPSDAKGVGIYDCLDYGQSPVNCPLVTIIKNTQFPHFKFFKPDREDLERVWTSGDIKSADTPPFPLSIYAYSLSIDPIGSLFAVLFTQDRFEGDCVIRNVSDKDLPEGTKLAGEYMSGVQLTKLNSMMIIKGSVVGSIKK